MLSDHSKKSTPNIWFLVSFECGFKIVGCPGAEIWGALYLGRGAFPDSGLLSKVAFIWAQLYMVSFFA